jgi:hypothetical protein
MHKLTAERAAVAQASYTRARQFGRLPRLDAGRAGHDHSARRYYGRRS